MRTSWPVAGFGLKPIAIERPGQVAFAVWMAFSLFSAMASASKFGSIEIGVNASSYQVELAITSAQRQRGLMFRDKLDPDKGMLFVYPESGDHLIWMKNTRIPLRVIWIDEDYRVISIQRLYPCQLPPCETYGARTYSRFILELGDYDHGISNGDIIMGLQGLD